MSKSVKKYDRVHIVQTMAKHFPFCPEESIDEIVAWVTDRSWTKRTRIVTAVSIAVHTHIRHRHTDYERHLKIHKMTRD
ncbi:MAG: DUF2293 domain-containing protein [Alphaproteobacteria bacterium]|nr:hypothetical protein [Hyphomonas sp.]MBR9808757.1 DUF2293 domain-containing protein [Alphaproteobacteria bacterium]|tara:strand:- start:11711 stop:11947 length:237 start_codon:yes stop_codon:yes gene_type:complete